MKLILDILRGMVIGLANIIPGVSGGTMMVSMGIYDKLIYSINHLFKEFKKSVKTLLPYFIGMGVAIVALSFVLKWAFSNYPLPTNTLFVGLILGGLPAILKQIKGTKKGIVGAVLFILFAAVVIILPILHEGEKVTIVLSAGTVIKLFLLGVLASSTMIIPGVSGSMMLKILGWYEPIVTDTIPAVVLALKNGDWAAFGAGLGVLLPFGVGIVVGIFAIAKLIELLLARWKGWTYCAILGMVAASPVTILMGRSNYENGINWITILISLATCALGFLIAVRLSGDPEPAGSEQKN